MRRNATRTNGASVQTPFKAAAGPQRQSHLRGRSSTRPDRPCPAGGSTPAGARTGTTAQERFHDERERTKHLLGQRAARRRDAGGVDALLWLRDVFRPSSGAAAASIPLDLDRLIGDCLSDVMDWRPRMPDRAAARSAPPSACSRQRSGRPASSCMRTPSPFSGPSSPISPPMMRASPNPPGFVPAIARRKIKMTGWDAHRHGGRTHEVVGC